MIPMDDSGGCGWSVFAPLYEFNTLADYLAVHVCTCTATGYSVREYPPSRQSTQCFIRWGERHCNSNIVLPENTSQGKWTGLKPCLYINVQLNK